MRTEKVKECVDDWLNFREEQFEEDDSSKTNGVEDNPREVVLCMDALEA